MVDMRNISPSQSKRWLFIHFYELGKLVDLYFLVYGKSFLIGDLNAEEPESCLATFPNDHNSANKSVTEETCFKSKNKPSCIDLFITNA